MLESATILRTTDTALGLYDSFFGGLYFAVGAPMMAQVCFLAAYSFALLCAGLFHTTRRKKWLAATLTLGLFSFALVCFFLTQPWDELFINLRHSFNLARHGVFSFNAREPIEGTVDFLPYFLIGLLGRTGLPMTELSFLQSGLGGVLCILAACQILASLKVKTAWTGAFLSLCLSAPLALNAAHGFTATSFSAAILWGMYFVFFSRRQTLGWVVLSLVPLIRVEGTLLVMMLWGYDLARAKRANLKGAVLIGCPIALLSLWRLRTFGNVLPLPILYKSTTAGFFFVLVGIRNLLADLINSGGLASVFLVAILLTECSKQKQRLFQKNEADFVPLLIIVSIFCATYYVSGGDWLPRYWARYMLPFSLLAFVAAWTVATRAWPVLSSPSRLLGFGISALIIFLQMPWFFSSYRTMLDHIFTHKKVMANIFSLETGPRHHRIHHLSQLGLHLKRSTDLDDRIASSEVATIMYFAERETIDLLGVANPEVVAQPPRTPPSLVRHFPMEAELPYLIFRRVNPAIVSNRLPEIIYTFDFFPSSLMREVPFEELTDEKIRIALNRWERKYSGLNGPLYGGIPRLLTLGYHPIVVFYENRFCSMYFVSDRIFARHVKRLRELGFSSRPL